MQANLDDMSAVLDGLRAHLKMTKAMGGSEGVRRAAAEIESELDGIISARFSKNPQPAKEAHLEHGQGNSAH